MRYRRHGFQPVSPVSTFASEPPASETSPRGCRKTPDRGERLLSPSPAPLRERQGEGTEISLLIGVMRERTPLSTSFLNNVNSHHTEPGSRTLALALTLLPLPPRSGQGLVYKIFREQTFIDSLFQGGPLLLAADRRPFFLASS